MAEARDKWQWNHTASVMALLAEIHRDHKKKPTPFQAADFHPHMRRAKASEPLTRETFGMMKELFVGSGSDRSKS